MNPKVYVDCNQDLQRASKIELFSNQWLQLYLKETVDSNQDLAKITKEALITKYANFRIETCLLSYQNQPTFISKVSHLRCVSWSFTMRKYATCFFKSTYSQFLRKNYAPLYGNLYCRKNGLVKMQKKL